MKLAYIKLGLFFGRDVTTLQQIADNTSLTVKEVLELDNIKSNTECNEYQSGLLEEDNINAKINGAGKVQYWKGVLSNV